MKLSVVLPVLNEQAGIAEVLSQLRTLLRELDEVIVVDGGSEDDTVEIASAHARVITSSPGRAAQMNAGAAIATGDVLLFLHADTVLPENAISLIETAIDDEHGWGRFDVRLSGSHWAFRFIERMMNLRSCLTSVATGDQAIFVTRASFDAVSGFDAMPLMEDVAISKKLRRRSPAICIDTPLITSSRRWEQHGIFRTVLLMWWLRWLYSIGVSPTVLADKYYPNRRSGVLLMVFAKAPVSGTVNTRLIPSIGERTATDLQKDLILQRMHQFAHQTHLDVQLHCAPDDSHELFQRCQREFDVTLRVQQGADLGERMATAMQHNLRRYEKVVLVGTDAPAVDMATVTQVVEALADKDVVIQPAEDGGYVLVAMRRYVKQVFEGIDWGTASVLQQTTQRLDAVSVDYALLESSWDIDTAEDYARYVEEFKAS